MNQFTEQRLRDKFITLLYIDNPDAFNPEANLIQQQGGPYRMVLQMPIAEFMGRTPIDLALELVQHTVSGAWREGRRRSVVPGDIFCLGTQPWLYINMAYARRYPINSVQGAGTDKGAIGIVQLPPNSVAKSDGGCGGCGSHGGDAGDSWKDICGEQQGSPF